MIFGCWFTASSKRGCFAAQRYRWGRRSGKRSTGSFNPEGRKSRGTGFHVLLKDKAAQATRALRKRCEQLWTLALRTDDVGCRNASKSMGCYSTVAVYVDIGVDVCSMDVEGRE